jgi:hypothetical protein
LLVEPRAPSVRARSLVQSRPDNRAYWRKQLREAEQEFAAAKRRTELNAATKRLQRAKAELKRLEAEKPDRSKRRSTPWFAFGVRFLSTW